MRTTQPTSVSARGCAPELVVHDRTTAYVDW
jgi:hypothetical protein